MLTICEGLDKCGKSTYLSRLQVNMNEAGSLSVAEYLAQAKIFPCGTLSDKGNVGFHFSHGANELEWLKYCIELSNQGHVYMDRSIISEMVYQPVYRPGRAMFDMIEMELALYKLKDIPHQILWFHREFTDAYVKELDGKDIYESDVRKLKAVYDGYNSLMAYLKFKGLNVYKITFEW